MATVPHSPGRASRWIGPVGGAALLLVLTLALVMPGQEGVAAAGGAAATVVWLMLTSGGVVLAYLGAGGGLGRLGLWALAGRRAGDDGNAAVRHRPSLGLQLGLGMAMMLWLSHLLGMLGLLSGPAGAWSGWIVVGAGLALLLDQVLRGDLRPEKWPLVPAWVMLAVPGVAVTLAAACNPPGSIWTGGESEAGGYDALSYHLELPKEWAAGPAGEGLLGAGRLWPVEHNVYSYLPGAMEAAYLHIAALKGAGRADGGDFVAHDGTGVIACQMLHLSMGVLTAVLVGRLVWCVLGRVAAGTPLAGVGALVSAATVVSIPWVMVVGSLAYNELAVCAMVASGLVACVERGLSPAARGVAAGFAAGMACSAKPTALFMGAPVVGLFLLWSVQRKDRVRTVLAGSAAGLAAIGPWLVRNWLAGGNPVFPFGVGVLGRAHWTIEQVERYATAHRFDGGTLARLALLFSSDRGLLHEQWGPFMAAGVVALLGCAAWRPTRAAAFLLAAGVAVQLAGWLFVTHLRARFLLPLVVPMGAAIGLAVPALGAWVGRTGTRRGAIAAVAVVAALLPVALAAWSAAIFLGQREGKPAEALLAGVGGMTGHAFFADFAAGSPARRREILEGAAAAPVFINFTFEPGDRVYLLGDATPLYYLPAGGPGAVLYHTTWDRSPLGEAVRAAPDDPGAWTRAVRGAMARQADWHGTKGRAGRGPGDDFVLVNAAELTRLSEKDHWYDPAVTPAVVRRWMEEQGEPVRSWPDGRGAGSGTYLYRLKGAAPGGGR